MATKYAGVDLSYANDDVDYSALKAGKIKGYRVKFAMLRLGHGTTKDKLFDKHYNGCKAAGIRVGVYHWTYASTPVEARKEAVWAINELAGYKIDYPVAMDFEDESIFVRGLSKARYTAVCRAYLDTLCAANYYPMLYCNPNIIENHLDLKSLPYDLWLAQYTSEGYQRDFGQGMWQFTVAGSPTLDYGEVGAVAGVKGQCDCDWAYVGYAAKIKELGLNKPAARYRVTGTKTVDKDGLNEAKGQLKALGFEVKEEKI